jgi:hypothetical protein
MGMPCPASLLYLVTLPYRDIRQRRPRKGRAGGPRFLARGFHAAAGVPGARTHSH